jgi:hypothetical protein
MKSISFSCAIALLAFAFSARAATVTYTPGTGVLLYPENFFEANSNSIVQAIAGAFPGTGSGNASTNVAQGWSALQVFDDVTVLGDMTVPGTISAAAFSTATPLGFSSGGHGATNAAGARTNLGLAIGSDVQAWSAYLQQIATVGWASGAVPYFDGSNLTNLATTAAGRTLLTAANAAAQWSALSSDALQSGAYDQAAWDGVTGKAVTPDQVRDIIQNLAIGSNAITEVTSPLSLSNGVLSINTAGLGGGSGGYTYIATNVGGAFQSRTAGTNWTILSTTVSSNYAPSAAGRFLEGGWSAVISNYSGTSANVYFNISANGTTVFRDAASLNNTMRGVNGALWLVRETDTTASIITLGSQSGPASVGQGDFGGTAAGAVTISTNVAWNWATNNTLLVEFQCDTATSTNDALGMRRAWAYLRAEAAASAGGTGDVVGPASSTANNIAVFADETGKVIADGGVTVSSLATEAEVAAGYQPLDADLTDLADGSLTGSKVGTGISADNITTGTITSNRLPAAVSFTTIDVGTINASAVVGDASGLTGINATNITAGELADARLVATIARTNAPTLHSPTLLTPSLGVASATSLTLGATNVVTDLALKAPLASPALTGTPTVNGTNLMAEVNGKQPLDADLTSLAAGTAIATAITNAVAVGAPTLYAGTTNVASALAGKAPLTSASLVTPDIGAATGTSLTLGTTNMVAALALKAPLASPTLASPTLNDTVTFEQATLAAHSAVTNFVADPTVSPYQTINADLTTAFTGVRFLHATNVAAGRQTTVLVFAGTNAAVSVALNSQFAFNTNLVALTTGQVLPVSFYGYGSSPTNVVATVGTIYTR